MVSGIALVPCSRHLQPRHDSLVSLSTALYPLHNAVCHPLLSNSFHSYQVTFSLTPGLVVYFAWTCFRYLFKQDVLQLCRITRYMSSETVPKSVSYPSNCTPFQPLNLRVAVRSPNSNPFICRTLFPVTWAVNQTIKHQLQSRLTQVRNGRRSTSSFVGRSYMAHAKLCRSCNSRLGGTHHVHGFICYCSHRRSRPSLGSIGIAAQCRS